MLKEIVSSYLFITVTQLQTLLKTERENHKSIILLYTKNENMFISIITTNYASFELITSLISIIRLDTLHIKWFLLVIIFTIIHMVKKQPEQFNLNNI